MIIEYFLVLAYGVVEIAKYMMHLSGQRLYGKASLIKEHFELPPGKEYFFNEYYAKNAKFKA